MSGDTDDRPTAPDMLFDRRAVLAGGTVAALAAAAPAPARIAVARSTCDALASAFDRPPREAGVGVYWYWLDGAVSRVGITADLEAMHANGITTAMIFAIGKAKSPPLVSPPADALTPQWWSLIDHAVAEADRLGMTLSLNICDGWATASGPWITPDRSMQVVTWSEARAVAGGFSPQLPLPPHRRDYYRDTALLAFPWPEAFDLDSGGLRPRVSTDLPIAGGDVARVLDPANRTDVFDTEAAGSIDFAFDRPFTLRSVTVCTPSPLGYSPGVYRAANQLEVFASDDGRHFSRIGALEYPQHGWQTDLTTLTHALPETTARVFRFVHRPAAPGPYYENYDFGQDVRLRLYSLVLSSRPELHQIVGKTAEQWSISRRTTSADIPVSACVDPHTIVDISDRLRPDGSVDWTPPSGRWRLLRIGSTTNGRENSAAGGAQGLEVDRFDRSAVTMQFDRWFGAALDRIGPDRAGRVLDTVHVDSWEASGQNWSQHFPDQFTRLRGYDLRRWLPVVAGVPVESAEISECVLADLRRTVADLTQSEFFDTVAGLAHARGCRFSGEPASPTYAVDGLRWAEATDVPMGEFWLRTPRNDKPTDIADAVSGGHVYGKRIIASESFTENDIRWDEHPALLKPLGDHHYCRGINRFMLHVYTAQPFSDRRPGMTLNGIGTMFSRTQTWWSQAGGWFATMARTQAMLQQGMPVADVAVFIGEDIPSRALLPHQLDAPLPPGFRYDSIDRTALIRDARVDAGDIVLSSGMRYRLLILRDGSRYSTGFLEALERLVRDGATVLAPPPLGPVGRETDMAAFRSRVATLWPSRGAAGERQLGAGRLIWGRTPAECLRRLRAEPGLLTDDPAIDWCQRRGDDWDAWFLANSGDAPAETIVSLRGLTRTLECWDPVHGTRSPAACWQSVDGRTQVPVRLAGAGSLFLVARRGAEAPHATKATLPTGSELAAGGSDLILTSRDAGRAAVALSGGRRLEPAWPAPPAPVEVGGPWSLDFAGWHAPPDRLTLDHPTAWSELAPARVRYHAGSGRYVAQVVLDGALFRPDLRLMLDLATVREIAAVRINGAAPTTLWLPPFRLDVTAALRPGPNRIEITVTNVWHNRLVGDRHGPDRDRIGWVYPPLRGDKDWLPAADAPLIPAGLAGPVRIVPEAVVRIPLA